jgi:hypothetical protein
MSIAQLFCCAFCSDENCILFRILVFRSIDLRLLVKATRPIWFLFECPSKYFPLNFYSETLNSCHPCSTLLKETKRRDKLSNPFPTTFPNWLTVVFKKNVSSSLREIKRYLNWSILLELYLNWFLLFWSCVGCASLSVLKLETIFHVRWPYIYQFQHLFSFQFQFHCLFFSFSLTPKTWWK